MARSLDRRDAERDDAELADDPGARRPTGVQDYLDLGLHGFAMSRYSGSWIAFKALDDTIECSASVFVDPARIDVRLPEDFTLPPGGLGLRLPDQPLTMERRIHEQRLPAVHAYVRANRLNRVAIDSPRRAARHRRRRQVVPRRAAGARPPRHRRARGGAHRHRACSRSPSRGRSSRRACTRSRSASRRSSSSRRSGRSSRTRSARMLYHWPDARRPRVLGKRDEDGSGGRVAVAADRRAARRADRAGDRRAHRALPRQDDASPSACDGCARKEDARASRRCRRSCAATCRDAGPRALLLLRAARTTRSTRVPEGSAAIAGVGCHFMATYIFPGTKIFSPMGSEGAAWVGHAPFTDTPHIFANMGDGTYYHSGLLSIRAAVVGEVAHHVQDPLQRCDGRHRRPAAAAAAQRARASRASSKRKASRRSSSSPTSRRSTAADAPFAQGRHGAPPRPPRRRAARAARGRRRHRARLRPDVRGREAPPPQARPLPRSRAAHRSSTRACAKAAATAASSRTACRCMPVETEFGRKRAIDQSSCNKDFSCQNGFCPSFVSVEGGRPRRGQALATQDAAVRARCRSPRCPRSSGPTSIVVAGVGGTGIITVGALLGMAAHLEGKGVSVLDMTGVAQKGGAVTTYVRIARASRGAPHGAHRRGRGQRGDRRDILCTAENAIMNAHAARRDARGDQHEPQRRPWRSSRSPTSQTPWDAMEDGPARRDRRRGRRASSTPRGLRSRCSAMRVATNLFLLGYAWQMGLVPVSRARRSTAPSSSTAPRSTRTGARSHGDGSPATIRRRVERAGAARRRTALGSDRALADSLDEAIARRVATSPPTRTPASRSATRALVDRVRAAERRLSDRDTRLTEAVARNYFKLLAIKDEYEVARLYTDGEFERQVAAAFEGDYRIALPLRAAAVDEARPGDRRAAQAPLRPVDPSAARVARAAQGTARHGWFDVVRPHRGAPARAPADRATTRRCSTRWSRTLRAETLDVAVELASLPASIRGYGHVKLANLEAAKAREAQLRGRLRARRRRTRRAGGGDPTGRS